MANGLFSNSAVNAQLRTSWESYQATAGSFTGHEEQVRAVKVKALSAAVEIAGASSDTVAFVDAVAKEGRSKRGTEAKNRYLFLTAEAADINGVLASLARGMDDYYKPASNLQKLSSDQNNMITRLKDTMLRITGNSAAVVATAAEPLQSRFNNIEAKLLELGDITSSVQDSRTLLQNLNSQGSDMVSSASAAANQGGLVPVINVMFNVLPVPLICLLLGMYALWRFYTSQSRNLVSSEGNLSDALADQQESILKLLDEMSALADGDLTVEAEVTDQITGAIADSVNFAVVEMRELVTQINRASVQVANESERAVSNAQSVSRSNTEQAEQITAAAQNMQLVTSSMREMSEQASTSSEMAAESLKAALQGTQAVRDTIEGMDDMREQIQDTSKRIKRLGESSQRIGDIVALIDDIAEQTNILSLNAAIQASMAGEAGRGFAVVSDEVQSLAERSTEATKKIAELVTIIQNDTNDAVSSMEKATQQVISGAKVANTAGSALAEIETVSERLSGLVEQISDNAAEQAKVVTNVAQSVSLVSDSSSDTSRKAQDSANSIAKLLELAKELETSVSRFKLPAS
jgi:twitching motility protein PilJ